jgi:SAM-dependent methyltransferase
VSAESTRFAASTTILAEHRALWEAKPALREVYGDYHRRLMQAMPGIEGPIVDLGGGSGHLKDSFPGVIVLDILRSSHVDIVGDAHLLPFADNCLRGVVMLDVLHHLERPITFLREITRVLKPGGRVAMIEPAMTPVARFFFTHFHQEPVDLSADPFDVTVAADPQRDPFDSNQAIPWLMFARQAGRKRFATVMPELRISQQRLASLIVYPLSGGFKPWSLAPPGFVAPVLRAEEFLMPLLGPFMAFRLMVVLEKAQSPDQPGMLG